MTWLVFGVCYSNGNKGGNKADKTLLRLLFMVPKDHDALVGSYKSPVYFFSFLIGQAFIIGKGK